jgi:hypothetical protein
MAWAAYTISVEKHFAMVPKLVRLVGSFEGGATADKGQISFVREGILVMCWPQHFGAVPLNSCRTAPRARVPRGSFPRSY